MIWTFSQKAPVIFFSVSQLRYHLCGWHAQESCKKSHHHSCLRWKDTVLGNRVNFNEMTQNCLNRKSPGQVVKVMRKQFSCSLDLKFYDTRLISTSSHKGIFSLWHQKRPPGNPLCRHPPFPEIPLAYWGPRCRWSPRASPSKFSEQDLPGHGPLQ